MTRQRNKTGSPKGEQNLHSRTTAALEVCSNNRGPLPFFSLFLLVFFSLKSITRSNPKRDPARAHPRQKLLLQAALQEKPEPFQRLRRRHSWGEPNCRLRRNGYHGRLRIGFALQRNRGRGSLGGAAQQPKDFRQADGVVGSVKRS